MRTKTGSFLKRIATGGVLAAGIGLLFATGCVLDDEEISDEELQEGELGDMAEGSLHLGDSEPTPTNADGEGVLTAICHFGASMSHADSEDLLVSESELPAHLGHGDVFGTCDEFFCGAS